MERTEHGSATRLTYRVRRCPLQHARLLLEDTDRRRGSWILTSGRPCGTSGGGGLREFRQPTSYQLVASTGAARCLDPPDLHERPDMRPQLPPVLRQIGA